MGLSLEDSCTGVGASAPAALACGDLTYRDLAFLDIGSLAHHALTRLPDKKGQARAIVTSVADAQPTPSSGGSYASLLREAFPAENRAALSGAEGDGGVLAAL